MVLEAFVSDRCCFVTLTYSDSWLPREVYWKDRAYAEGSLSPMDVKVWLRELRRKFEGKKIRYFLVGEYGDETHRPHYHVMLYGLGPEDQEVITNVWRKGMVHVGEVSTSSAQYVAGYVTKKMTAEDDPRLMGKFPEFTRMSLKPGIGAPAMKVIAAMLKQHGVAAATRDRIDVQDVVRFDGKEWPLGNYLKAVLREIETGDRKVPKEVTRRYEEELRGMLKEARATSKEKAVHPFKLIMDKFAGKINQVEKRSKIWKKRATL
jgi:hypothetical protein